MRIAYIAAGAAGTAARHFSAEPMTSGTLALCEKLLNAST